jgi:hypothetical protein
LNNKVLKKFPKEIEDFGNMFVQAQIKRHDADYNPAASFTRSEVIIDIDDIEKTIKDFSAAPISDRRAFAAWVALQSRT